MAEVTAFRNNALPYPVYGVPWTIVFPMLDEDGDPVTGLTCDSEVSINGDTGADCTNEAAEVPFTTATNKGMYYLTLTAAEMTGDIITVTVYSGATTTQATCIVLYPRKLVTLVTGTSQGGAAGYITLAAGAVAFNGQYSGCLCVATIDTVVEARILQVCTASNQQCTVTPNWVSGDPGPDANDTYVIYLPEGIQIPTVNATHVAGTAQTAGDILGVWTPTKAGYLTRELTDAVLATAIWNAATATYGSAGSYGLYIETALPAAAAGAKSGLPILDAATGLILTGFGAGTVKSDLIDAPNGTAVTAIQLGLSKPGTAQTITANQAVNTAQWGGAALPTIPGAAPDAAAIEAAAAAAIAAALVDTGITLPKALEMLAAFMAGKVTRTSAGGVTTVTYKKRDGSTTSFTAVCDEDDGDRATTGDLT